MQEDAQRYTADSRGFLRKTWVFHPTDRTHVLYRSLDVSEQGQNNTPWFACKTQRISISTEEYGRLFPLRFQKDNFDHI